MCLDIIIILFRSLICGKKEVLVKMIIISTIILFTCNLPAQTPDWLWAVQPLGDSDERVTDITTDNQGNIYITGYYENSIIFDSDSLLSIGENDIFVAKLDSEGNWIWATQAGGTDYDKAYGITNDNEGNIYITGMFGDMSTFGTSTLTSYGQSDIFVAKLDHDGNWLWAAQAGGTQSEIAYDIDSDNFSNCYITGYFNGTTEFGDHTLISNSSEIFVAEISSDGFWNLAAQAGGGNSDIGYAISVSDEGNVFITGKFEDNATFGSHSLIGYGWSDIFAAKMDNNGEWQWAIQAGSNGANERGSDIIYDDLEYVYFTGKFEGQAEFGPFILNSYGARDIFTAKLDLNGNWIWATHAGGESSESGKSIALGDWGNIYITGDFYQNIHFNEHFLINIDGDDVFVANQGLDSDWLWAVQADCDDEGEGLALTTDNAGNIYATGCYEDRINFGSHFLICDSSCNLFVAKLGYAISNNDEYVPKYNRVFVHPNPFKNNTTIKLSLDSIETQANISIFNIEGQFIEEWNVQNNHTEFTWDAKKYSTGIYLLKLKTESYYEVQKLMIIK